MIAKGKSSNIGVYDKTAIDNIESRIAELSGYMSDIAAIVSNQKKFYQLRQDLGRYRAELSNEYDYLLVFIDSTWVNIMLNYKGKLGDRTIKPEIISLVPENPPKNDYERKLWRTNIFDKWLVKAAMINNQITHVNDSLEQVRNMIYSFEAIKEIYKIKGEMQ